MDFKDRYTFDPAKDLLGKGGFARVFRAWDVVRKRYVALKYFQGDWSEKYDIIGEISRMERIVHPNLIQYYDATIVKTPNAYGTEDNVQVGIMEYAPDGSLQDFMRSNPSQAEIKEVVDGILSGLEVLHRNNILHRDIKPQNILMAKEGNRWVPKISDFGLSKQMEAEEASSSQLLGTIEYMAPEQFNPKRFGIDGQISTNVDLWSFGAIVYEIFKGQPPFGQRSNGDSTEQILSNIIGEELPADIGQIPVPFASIVQRCLVKKAADRAQDPAKLREMLQGDPEATQVLDAPTLVMDRPPKREEKKTTPQKGLKGASARSSTSAESRPENGQTASVPPKKDRSRMWWIGSLSLVVIVLLVVALLLPKGPNLKEQLVGDWAMINHVGDLPEYMDTIITFTFEEDNTARSFPEVEPYQFKYELDEEGIFLYPQNLFAQQEEEPKPEDPDYYHIAGIGDTLTLEYDNWPTAAFERIDKAKLAELHEAYEKELARLDSIAQAQKKRDSSIWEILKYKPSPTPKKTLFNYRDPDGNRMNYTGELKNGIPHGQGEATYLDFKGSYVGAWKEGRRSGQGRFTMESGNVYIGGFFQNNYHGNYRVEDPQGNVLEEGVYFFGKRVIQ